MFGEFVADAIRSGIVLRGTCLIASRQAGFDLSLFDTRIGWGDTQPDPGQAEKIEPEPAEPEKKSDLPG